MTTTPRVAAVGPYAAALVLQQLRRSGYTSASVRAHAEMLRRSGAPVLAAEVEASWAQLVAAAADHRARHDAAAGATSDDGSAEAEIEEVEASSVPAVRREIDSSSAGALLKVSSRTVTSWARAGVLPGRRSGRAWLVDLDAVNALAAERSRAS